MENGRNLSVFTIICFLESQKRTYIFKVFCCVVLLLLLLFATKKLYKDDLRQMYDNIERRVQRVEKTALDNVIAVSS